MPEFYRLRTELEEECNIPGGCQQIKIRNNYNFDSGITLHESHIYIYIGYPPDWVGMIYYTV